MKKSIFKRVISIVLALAMLASMAVGMSTSVSAATNSKPGKVDFYVASWKPRVPDSNDKLVNSKEYNDYVSDINLKWSSVANAVKYRIKVNYKVGSEYRHFEAVTSQKAYTLKGMPFLYDYATLLYGTGGGSGRKPTLSAEWKTVLGDKGKGVYDISVTAINSLGQEGKSTNLYELKPSISSGHVPCMSEASLISEDLKKTGKESIILSKTTAKVTLVDKGLPISTKKNGNTVITPQFLNQGFKIRFEEFGSGKNRCGVTVCSTPATSHTLKSCTVRGLEPGCSYVVFCQPYVVGYNNKSIYGKEQYLCWVTMPY